MRLRLPRLRRSRGRILAVKWGVNPNSSSLGVDVTFLLFGLGVVTLLTPIIALFLRASGRVRRLPAAVAAARGEAVEAVAAAHGEPGGETARERPGA